MCGIYGVLELRQNRQPGEEDLTRMGNAMVHRGPDDQGCYSGNGIVLGMRRLSIIDVQGGHQPIGNEDESVWVVCNGEIYNFKELRAQLKDRGHVFRCNSDTEVIVHLYEQFGLDFLARLRGMFAIALWDAAKSRLVLARDRLGKKPLYVCREPHRVSFASEIKSLLEVCDIPRELSTDALQDYLALGYVPAPSTLFDRIQKLLPGHYMVVERGAVRQQEYWNIPVRPADSLSEEEWAERVRDKLFEAVRIRMVSDVPLGAFLSGGIDSSAIVAAMARLSDRPVKTYSIGFEGRDRFYNELPYAQLVAKKFGTDHHEILVRPNVADLLPALIWHLDEPIADSAFVTTYLVARLAGQSVKVILSGVGGDELFGGYRRYLGRNLAGYYQLLPQTVRKRMPAAMARLPQDRHSKLKNYLRYADAFVKSADSTQAGQYLSYVTLFPNDLRSSLLNGGFANRSNGGNGCASPTMQSYFETYRDVPGINQLVCVDLKTSLPDDLLALTDKMTMAASVECRAPFVDHELVELTCSIPGDLKVHGLRLKYILKKALQPWLPREILERKKRGFGAPMGSWIRSDLSLLVDGLLSENQLKRRGLFNPVLVREMVAKHRSQKADYTDQLLALVNLELWCRIFLDGQDHRDCAHMISIRNCSARLKQ
jgi:asparagine synthase (glutamine-hydrolysing)